MNNLAQNKPQFNYLRSDLAQSLPLESPYVIYIETSSFCNLECKFCPQHISPEHIVKDNMSVETFTKLINEIKNFKTKPKVMRFCGLGDPLFNKKFVNILKIAYESEAVEKLELISNGLLLNEKIIPSLAQYLDRIIISIEGLSSGDYQKFALRKVNYEKFLSNLKFLSEQKKKAKLHIKIHNSAVQTKDKQIKFFDIFSNIADEIYIENLVNLWPEITSNLGLESGHRFDGGDLNKVKVCPQIFKSMQINSDGRVIPCCIDWKGLNIIGDVKKKTLKEIWNGEKLKNLRNKHLEGKRHDFSPCKGCTMNEYSDKDNLDSSAKEIYNKINL
tara:strand:+ start:172 stop:1164 length:993 start_codon:yes stop_codon:yes gene_type:complete